MGTRNISRKDFLRFNFLRNNAQTEPAFNPQAESFDSSDYNGLDSFSYGQPELLPEFRSLAKFVNDGSKNSDEIQKEEIETITKLWTQK